MKDKFDFYDLKSPIRKKLQRPFLLKEQLPLKDNLEALIKTLWQRPQ